MHGEFSAALAREALVLAQKRCSHILLRVCCGYRCAPGRAGAGGVLWCARALSRVSRTTMRCLGAVPAVRVLLGQSVELAGRAARCCRRWGPKGNVAGQYMEALTCGR